MKDWLVIGLLAILLLGILLVIGYGMAWSGDAIMNISSDSVTQERG